MDRQVTYPGAIPLETDILNTNRYSMIGLGMLALDLLGASTLASGLACTPTSPASLNVQIAPGRLYSLQNVDNTAYSTLPLDITHQTLKQGILADAVALGCAAPGTFGFSINYLIQAAYQDSDTSLVVLPYYNADNPSQAFSGPANNGTAQATARKGIIAISAKPGTAATTGTQTTPAPDTGFVGLWVVTVANGQATISAGNITQAAGAPFLSPNGAIHGSQRFTANGTFIVPPGVTQIYVSGCGGGGGGASGAGNSGISGSAGGGGGGGAAQSAIKSPFAVTPGQSISITIGAAGVGSTGGPIGGSGAPGGGGGATLIGSLLTLGGGAGGAPGIYSATPPGAGGAGGAGSPNGGTASDGGAGLRGGQGASGVFGGGAAGAAGAFQNTPAGATGPAGGFGAGGGGGAGCYAAVPVIGGGGSAGSPGLVVIEW